MWVYNSIDTWFDLEFCRRQFYSQF